MPAADMSWMLPRPSLESEASMEVLRLSLRSLTHGQLLFFADSLIKEWHTQRVIISQAVNSVVESAIFADFREEFSTEGQPQVDEKYHQWAQVITRKLASDQSQASIEE